MFIALVLKILGDNIIILLEKGLLQLSKEMQRE